VQQSKEEEEDVDGKQLLCHIHFLVVKEFTYHGNPKTSA
jgi:hypothetical protein